VENPVRVGCGGWSRRCARASRGDARRYVLAAVVEEEDVDDEEPGCEGPDAVT